MSKSTGRGVEELRFEYGGQPVVVAVRFRRGERLVIHVHPDLSVTALAPANRTKEQVLARLRARAPWILRQQRELASYRPPVPARRYVSGESHLYLGRQYRLRVRQAGQERVWLEGGYIRINAPDRRNVDRIRDLLQDWYQTRAHDVLNRRYRAWLTRAPGLGAKEGGMVVRRMRIRWGSCTKNGKVLLNPDLVKVPVRCIDYVVLHEMCHLQVLRHNKRFFDLLRRHMPDWERWRKRLNGFVLPLDDAGR